MPTAALMEAVPVTALFTALTTAVAGTMFAVPPSKGRLSIVPILNSATAYTANVMVSNNGVDFVIGQILTVAATTNAQTAFTVLTAANFVRIDQVSRAGGTGVTYTMSSSRAS